MSAQDTRRQIEAVLDRLVSEVPSLGQLKLVIKLELIGRGGAAVWRVEVPGPSIDRDSAGGARIEVVIQRADFNQLSADASLRDWATAYDRGKVKVTGDPAVIKLLGSVLERTLARSR